MTINIQTVTQNLSPEWINTIYFSFFFLQKQKFLFFFQIKMFIHQLRIQIYFLFTIIPQEKKKNKYSTSNEIEPKLKKKNIRFILFYFIAIIFRFKNNS